MGGTWGRSLRLSIFGESHGPSIGIIISGLPPGTAVDMDDIRRRMRRRAPGADITSTPRREQDEVEIQSGVYNGFTTGAPLCGLIFNADARSRDYGDAIRPGHADLTAELKYGGFSDYRGGGHFSGRLTAPLVFAGGICARLLAKRGVAVGSRIASVGGIGDDLLRPLTPEILSALAASRFPTADFAAGERMREAVIQAGAAGDSLGGVVEAAAFGLPAGLGEPFFESAESLIASLMFSIPAVKGVEFGGGFALAGMRGSQSNDPLFAENGRIYSETNNCGGILGGITNAMPLTVRVGFKPTPSISLPQRTVDRKTGENTVAELRGRHDPCVVPRAVPVVEACLALALTDMLLYREGFAAFPPDGTGA